MQKQLFSKTAARAPRAAQWVAVDRSEMPVTVPALDGTFDSHVVGRKAGSMLQLQIATNLWAPFKRHKNESCTAGEFGSAYDGTCCFVLWSVVPAPAWAPACVCVVCMGPTLA